MHTTSSRSPSWSCSVPIALSLVLSSGCLSEPDELSASDEGLVEELDANLEFRAASARCPNVINDGVGLMRYCRNHNIYVDDSSVTRAIITIHGSSLNPDTYYAKTITEAQAEGVDLDTLDVIAPEFFEGGVPTSGTWTNYYWWSGGWRYGNMAYSPSSTPSYAMIDHIIEELIDHRPNLETIVIAGQSAGGQFVSRYALGTSVAHPGVDLRFWSANAGGYMWLDDDRPESTCSGFNDYPFGLDSRNAYMGAVSDATIRDNAVTRDIFWTVGENDTSTDTGCNANSQGLHRQERWENHRAMIGDVCVEEGFAGLYCLFHTARHAEIPGCGHFHPCSWESDEGHEIMFGS